MSRPAGVLAFSNALHNYRREPSPENMRALMIAGDVVCTCLVTVTEKLESLMGTSAEACSVLEQVTEQLELEREKVPLPRELCTCGGRFQKTPRPIYVPLYCQRAFTERCDCCGVFRLTAFYSVGAPGDAG